ncbi:formate-dependent phosphoribosylglycinamide formyltransferase [Psychromonas sp. 14N.309.X.WAT.B.A12]|uniref:formate-dependent phosphoribosylglycinamide formyltransferase n=1 Tax=Psychromonas sp. 14N.309.X.WAT.B.A12 TaxID=2998322 RepID=UPI0025B1A5EB|nr:formate-dependent phosphoribosylglycinamide formyltransferase [Psychromonas sp. 14N.309.X.WAT.B.A12]MDN2663703.1 formate-dependent phosphoribosylglycinamide formyltransferase [Psychromonas sp. 14N.309.X.WAT.B.A12]
MTHPILGTATSASATKALLLGSGELGKEVAIELQRFGIEVIAADSYANAPAMQIAHRSHVVSMLDGKRLEEIIRLENPDFIIPEVEAIATDTLLELEQQGFNVVPTARAAKLTMDREGIRRLAAETLSVKTSPYIFADTKEEYLQAVKEIGQPCVIKPVMSSSGKGQSVVKTDADLDNSWTYSQEGGRTGEGRIIIEGFVPFDYEITLLTVSAVDGIHFCAPIGHRQEDGDYRESWQPQAMSETALQKAQAIATKVVTELGGFGLFGMEFFVKGDEVYFSEVSPRPHDTGLVTLISQDLSEFALHVRAILGFPIGNITQYGPSASSVILGNGTSQDIQFEGVATALGKVAGSQIRLFAKPNINGGRRLGVAIARGENIEQAIESAKSVSTAVNIVY